MNPNIAKSKASLTQEEYEKIKRWKQFPTVFIEECVKVVHPVRGIVPFLLYPFQKRIINDVEQNRFNILRKFRQAGCTTLASAYAIWFCLFKKAKTVAVLSKGEIEATEIIERIKLMYDELPAFLKAQIPLVEDNKHKLKFGVTGSSIRSRSSAKQSGRSLAGSLLIIDEAAFIENIQALWQAVYPIISTGGKAFVLSTVNGIGNWYFNTYQGAIEKVNSFHAIDISWEEHPEYKRQDGFEHLYQEMEEKHGINVDDWEATTKGNIDHRQWLQEFCAVFLGTGDTFVDGSVLTQLKENTSKEYASKHGDKLRIWKRPHPAYEYVMAVDTSMGRGKDYSAFHIINLYNGEQVSEFYSNRVPPNEFAKIIVASAKHFNTCPVYIERDALGSNVIDHCFNVLEYENIWMDEKGDFGIKPMQVGRDQMLSKMEECLRLSQVKINSERTVQELLTFVVTEKQKAEADDGCHDDLVMSLSLACHAFLSCKERNPVEYSVANSEEVKPLEPQLRSRYMNREFKEELEWLTR